MGHRAARRVERRLADGRLVFLFEDGRRTSWQTLRHHARAFGAVLLPVFTLKGIRDHRSRRPASSGLRSAETYERVII